MADKNDIVYSINIEDIQNVSEQELDRELTPEEMKLVADRIGDYIPWYDAIAFAINELIVKEDQ